MHGVLAHDKAGYRKQSRNRRKQLRCCEKASLSTASKIIRARDRKTQGKNPPAFLWQSVERASKRKTPSAVHPWMHLESSMTKQQQEQNEQDENVRVPKNGPGNLLRDEQY